MVTWNIVNHGATCDAAETPLITCSGHTAKVFSTSKMFAAETPLSTCSGHTAICLFKQTKKNGSGDTAKHLQRPLHWKKHCCFRISFHPMLQVNHLADGFFITLRTAAGFLIAFLPARSWLPPRCTTAASARGTTIGCTSWAGKKPSAIHLPKIDMNFFCLFKRCFFLIVSFLSKHRATFSSNALARFQLQPELPAPNQASQKWCSRASRREQLELFDRPPWQQSGSCLGSALLCPSCDRPAG